MAEEPRGNDILGQIESRLEALKPPEKTRGQVIIDRTLTALLVALTIGFFAVMWQRSELIDVENPTAQVDTAHPAAIIGLCNRSREFEARHEQPPHTTSLRTRTHSRPFRQLPGRC